MSSMKTTPAWWLDLVGRSWPTTAADHSHLRRERQTPGIEPASRIFGFDRGLPVDRVYIERFLAQHRGDIRGRVLEIGDDAYTQSFGSGVSDSQILDVSRSNSKATLVDDLAAGSSLPSAAFDCVILTQTLQLVFDLNRAVATVCRILAPGGVVLATVPWITQIQDEQWREAWNWSLTQNAARRLFGQHFEAPMIEVVSYGNLTTAIAFLLGLAADEVPSGAFVADDRDFPLITAVRARKARREN